MVVTRGVPAFAWSGGVVGAVASVFKTSGSAGQVGKDDDEVQDGADDAAYREAYGMDKASKEELTRLMIRYLFAEGGE